MTVALVLEDVSLRYGSHAVLEHFSLSVGAGQMAALLGPSGGGKTSVLRLLLGLAAPQGGRVLLGDRPASVDDRIVIPPEARELAVVFQDLALWPHLTVYGNLDFVLGSRGVPSEARQGRIRELEGGRIVQEGSLAELRKRPASAFIQSVLEDLAWVGAPGG